MEIRTVVGILIIMIMHTHLSFSQEHTERRMPAVAGRFYPSEPDTLRAEVSKFLAEASKEEKSSRVQAVIVPHAGYVFSGRVAARAFARIAPETSYRHVFLLGPSHHAAFDGASVDGACGSYVTPLGEIRVAGDICTQLLKSDEVFCYLPKAHEKEHCLEVELPFLQERLHDMPSIVPVVVGTQDIEKLRRVAEALQPYFTAENLFVISSDFSHYPDYADALSVDKATEDAILSASLHQFLKTLETNAGRQIPHLLTSACGQAPIAVLLMLIQHSSGLHMEHLAYSNSGDSPYGGRDQVVGYHAFAAVREAEAEPSYRSDTPFVLTPEEKRTLLQIARRSINRSFTGRGQSVPDSSLLTDSLRKDCGAFVTLHLHGKLRGCIGSLTGRQPLHVTVAGMARAAAFEDPRFCPLTEEELEEVQIEISVLSPLRRIYSIREFELGRHGILIVKGTRRGTFLPQVAEETHWTKEEFLGHCARDKAGLGWEGWKDAELYVYEAEVFHE